MTSSQSLTTGPAGSSAVACPDDHPVVASVLDARPGIEGEARLRVGMGRDALDLISVLGQVHGPLVFHQPGGCCDGFSPMCFPDSGFRAGGSDVLFVTFDLPSGNACRSG
jgi:uncharacterized protein